MEAYLLWKRFEDSCKAALTAAEDAKYMNTNLLLFIKKKLRECPKPNDTGQVADKSTKNKG